MNKNALEAIDYTQKFKNFSIANVNFKAPVGTIHALIGESGSGKSVIIKSVIGALPNYTGKIMINGIPAKESTAKLSLGFSTNLEEFPGELTAYRFLTLLGELSSLSKSEIKNNIEYLMTYFGLWDHRNKKLRSYSSGMKNRIMIVHSMINNPDLMIFDEPGANLDYKNRCLFYRFLQMQKSRGKTIFLTTHMIDEMEPIIDDCTIISLGKFLYTGPYAFFKEHMDYQIKTTNNQLFFKLLQKLGIRCAYNAGNDEIMAAMVGKVDLNYFFNFASKYNFKIIHFKEIVNDLTQLKVKLNRLQKTKPQNVAALPNPESAKALPSNERTSRMLTMAKPGEKNINSTTNVVKKAVPSQKPSNEKR